MARTNLGTTTILTYPLDGSDVSSSPTTKIPYTAMQHAYTFLENFELKIGDTPVNAEVLKYRSNGVSTVLAFRAGCNDTGTSASITIDLLKNGVSILSAPITITHSDADRTALSGTVSSPTLADGDLLSIKLITSSTTGMKGPYAELVTYGAAAPL